MVDRILYLIVVLVWGSTWLAVTFQLGPVAPELSVAYRFAIAAALLLAFCRLTGRPLRFAPRDHGFLALQGLCLFCLNYVFHYAAMLDLTSGLVAVAFSTVAVMNILFAGLFFRQPVRPRALAGAALGLAGIALVFRREVAGFGADPGGVLGLALALVGTVSASLGMMTSLGNYRRGLPVLSAAGYGMAYGAGFTLAIALVRGVPLAFDLSFAYVTALLYLAVFGSILAFGSFLTLQTRIGADRAAYANVLVPIVALALSTVFEGYTWSVGALAGVGLVLAGNLLVVSRSRPRPTAVPAAALAVAPAIDGGGSRRAA
jgi:drug/metabolite transporter (DMT)-like permease